MDSLILDHQTSFIDSLLSFEYLPSESSCISPRSEDTVLDSPIDSPDDLNLSNDSFPFTDMGFDIHQAMAFGEDVFALHVPCAPQITNSPTSPPSSCKTQERDDVCVGMRKEATLGRPRTKRPRRRRARQQTKEHKEEFSHISFCHASTDTSKHQHHETTDDSDTYQDDEENYNDTSSGEQDVYAHTSFHSQREKNEVKRQRRLMKNRESAQASRQRRKHYVDELQRKVAQMAEENARIVSENSELKCEVAFLRAALHNQSPSTGTNESGIIDHSSHCCTSLDFRETQLHHLPHHQLDLPQHNLQAAGFFLVVVWFTCILFTRVATPPPLSLAPTRSTSTLSSGPLPKSSNTKATCSIESSDAIPSNIERTTPGGMKRKRGASMNMQNKSARTISASPRRRGSQKSSTSNVVEEVRHDEQHLGGKQVVENPRQPHHVLDVVPLISEWRPNTTYLMCSSVSQISPPEHIHLPHDDNAPLMLSFFIPPDSLSAESTAESTSQTLEVTCQVVNINFVPTSAASQMC